MKKNEDKKLINIFIRFKKNPFGFCMNTHVYYFDLNRIDFGINVFVLPSLNILEKKLISIEIDF